jgi:hypothetical protein
MHESPQSLQAARTGIILRVNSQANGLKGAEQALMTTGTFKMGLASFILTILPQNIRANVNHIIIPRE